jgi:hypothetical protein
VGGKGLPSLRCNSQKGLWATADKGLFDREITGTFKRY